MGPFLGDEDPLPSVFSTDSLSDNPLISFDMWRWGSVSVVDDSLLIIVLGNRVTPSVCCPLDKLTWLSSVSGRWWLLLVSDREDKFWKLSTFHSIPMIQSLSVLTTISGVVSPGSYIPDWFWLRLWSLVSFRGERDGIRNMDRYTLTLSPFSYFLGANTYL